MKMITAVIRPEKEAEIVLALEGAGFPAVTKSHVFGRGKQKGLDVGPIHYDELPKVELVLVVKKDEVKKVLEVIESKAKTGFIGDGKVFVTPVEEVYTIRTGKAGL